MPDRSPRSAYRCRLEGILGEVRNPARLVGGEFGAGPGFSEAGDELRVVLAFPDAYEIAISNQAIQILYEVAARCEGVAVERAVLPWVDVADRLAAESLAIPTLETWSPVGSAHVVGLSLQHELNFTNALEFLALGRIPVWAGRRTEEHPLVVAGGPATANFLPMAPFLDAVVVGDGETAFAELLSVERHSLSEGLGRAARKSRLSEIEGVYVPGVSAGVRRRVERRLEGLPYPVPCLVPLTGGVHDRAWVEVMRGCTRGCRFCQAGMWYRPVRERTPQEVVRLAEAELDATGYDDLALASLSTTDYSGLHDVLDRLAYARPEVQISLPSLRVDSAAVRLGHQTSPAGSSVTLAPEAGSARMRNAVNKNVREEEIVEAVREAVRLGRTKIKLYFMIGLPGERDEDVEAIVELCRRLRDEAAEVREQGRRRTRFNVSVSNFVPKPFTPFQWAGMATPEILERRQRILRAGLRGKWVDLSLHDLEPSYVEGALARGGEEMAPVIEDAWRKGARFDSWTDRFHGEAWKQAFSAAGTSAEELATRRLSFEEEAPWTVIDGGISEEFLRGEWERAVRGEVTPDCRWDVCSQCGACTRGLALDLVGEAGAPGPRALLDPAAEGRSAPAAADGEGRETGAGGSPAVRYAFTVAVRGRARFLGHLDRLEILRRAVRRAGGRPALSAGMRPKPLLALALPLAVGVESEGEIGEVALADIPPKEFAQRLSATLPQGMAVRSLEPYQGKTVTRRVTGARYRVELAGSADRGHESSELRAASGRYTRLTDVYVERIRPQKRKVVNVRSYVDAISVVEGDEGTLLEFTAAVTPEGSVRPEEVVEALGRLAGCEMRPSRIVRTRILLG